MNYKTFLSIITLFVLIAVYLSPYFTPFVIGKIVIKIKKTAWLPGMSLIFLGGSYLLDIIYSRGTVEVLGFPKEDIYGVIFIVIGLLFIPTTVYIKRNKVRIIDFMFNKTIPISIIEDFKIDSKKISFKTADKKYEYKTINISGKQAAKIKEMVEGYLHSSTEQS